MIETAAAMTSGRPTFPDLTVVVVAYNSQTILEKHAPFLAALAHVIVVDNASTDGTADFVAGAYPAFQLIRCPENLGFGRANNLGLERTTTDFALVLNPDCAFDADALDELFAAAARYPEAAILSPKLYNAAGNAQESYNVEFFDQHREWPYHDPVGDACACLVPGAAMFLRMAAMRKVGFFDPKIFMYFEDDDLCMRARAAGHSVVIVAGARLQHLVGKSSRRSLSLLYKKYFHESRSRIYFFGKYRSREAAKRIARGLFWKNLGKLPLFTLSMNSHMIVRSWARVRASAPTVFGAS